MKDEFLNGLALLETAGGKKTIKGPNGEDSFNLYNIKDFSGKGGFKAFDKAEKSNDAYRVYASPDESKADLLGLLGRKYPDALTAETPEAFATALKKGGYATDPLYITKLTNAIKKSGGSTSSDPLSAFASQGYGDAIKVARERGYTDQEIAQKLSGAGQSVVPAAVQTQLAKQEAGGDAVSLQLQTLRKNGYQDTINIARERGYSDADIVAKLGGEVREQGTAAKEKQAKVSGWSNFMDQAIEASKDLGRGASQLYSEATGDKEGAQAKYAEESARRGDLDRIAASSNTSGAIGRAAPALAATAGAVLAAPFTGGGSLAAEAAILGGAGAAMGALKPQVEEGRRLESALTEGAMGAAGGAAGRLAMAAPGMAARGTQSFMRGGQSQAELIAARDALVKEGITPGAADISARAAKAANAVDNNAAGASWFGADARGARDVELAGAIGKRVGVDDAADISSALVRKAQSNITKLYDDALDGVKVDLDAPFMTKLDNIVQANAGGSLPSLTSKLPASLTDELKTLGQTGPVSAKTLQQIRSSIGKEMSSPSAEASAKQALGDIYGAINDQIAAKLPAKNLEAFKKANTFYKNLQPVETMVRMSGDSGTVSVRQLTNAIKQGKLKSSFERGDAPFQDLQQALVGSTAGSGGRIGLDAATKAVGLGALTNPAAPVASGIAGNLAMRILTNPKYRDVLLGLNPVQKSALMQAAAKVGPMSGAAAMAVQD
jgi:hypothetical protein